MEGKRASWDVMGKEREERGTGFFCKTKEPVFTSPDSKHTLFLTRLCACVRVCVWLVSGESDALTQCLSRLFDALLGFQWNTNMEVWVCARLRRLRRMTKQSRRSSEAHKAPWQQMCVCVCLRERERESERHTLARHYYIYYKGLQLSKVMWVIGTEVSRGFQGFSSYPERLVGFILNNTSTHPHTDMLTDNTVQDSVSIQERNSSVSNRKKAEQGVLQDIPSPHVLLEGEI